MPLLPKMFQDKHTVTLKKEGKNTPPRSVRWFYRSSKLWKVQCGCCLCVLTGGLSLILWGVCGANFRSQMSLAKLPFLESWLRFIIRMVIWMTGSHWCVWSKNKLKQLRNVIIFHSCQKEMNCKSTVSKWVFSCDNQNNENSNYLSVSLCLLLPHLGSHFDKCQLHDCYKLQRSQLFPWQSHPCLAALPCLLRSCDITFFQQMAQDPRFLAFYK